jgi:hypothetical protein
MANDRPSIQCETHGTAFQTFVCRHLVDKPKQNWFSAERTESNQWPDAWCADCNVLYKREGEWNDRNSEGLKVALVCNICYEHLRGWRSPS